MIKHVGGAEEPCNTQTISQKPFALAPKCCCVRLYGNNSAWLKVLETLLDAAAHGDRYQNVPFLDVRSAVWLRIYNTSVLPLQDELPERLLGTCRLEHLDLNSAAHLDIETGVITRKLMD